MNNEQPRVYSYLRFSDPKQAAGSSADRQTQYAEKWAVENAMVLDDRLTLRDEGLSAYHQRHVKQGAFGTFMEAVRQGRIPDRSVLVVEGLDRMSRAEPVDAMAQLLLIITAGVTVVTVADNRIYSRESVREDKMALMYSLMVMVRAHEESETKSVRVKASIKRLCEKWIDGTFRGRIRNGSDPAWCRWNGTAFEFVPDRAEAFRYAIDLFIRGYGSKRLDKALKERGLQLMAKSDTSAYYTVFRRQDLVGTRTFTVDGQDFTLLDYYPRLIDDETYARLQLSIASRTRKPRKAEGKSDVPSIFTGLGIVTCGECGSAVTMQTHRSRYRRDGVFHEGHRRLRCSNTLAQEQLHPGRSCTALHVERAVIDYCSDQLNLESLVVGHNPTADLRLRKAAIVERIDGMQRQLDKITTAMLDDDGEGLPQALLKKAREIEKQVATVRKEESEIDAALLTTARDAGSARADVWSDLREAVFAGNYDARIRCRKLVEDTFQSIEVFFVGVRGDGGVNKHMDIMMQSHSGNVRMIRVSRKDGAFVVAGEMPATTK